MLLFFQVEQFAVSGYYGIEPLTICNLKLCCLFLFAGVLFVSNYWPFRIKATYHYSGGKRGKLQGTKNVALLLFLCIDIVKTKTAFIRFYLVVYAL